MEDSGASIDLITVIDIGATHYQGEWHCSLHQARQKYDLIFIIVKSPFVFSQDEVPEETHQVDVEEPTDQNAAQHQQNQDV